MTTLESQKGSALVQQSKLDRAAVAVVRPQEVPSGSIYKNSFNNRAKLSLVFGQFSSVIINYLAMTFTSRLKTDARQ